MKTTYKDMPDKIRHSVPFVGESVSAYYTDDNEYVIKSYQTEIFRTDGEFARFDDRKYSVTTGRIQRIIRDVFNIVQPTNIVGKRGKQEKIRGILYLNERGGFYPNWVIKPGKGKFHW
jgi:hypothetical protein